MLSAEQKLIYEWINKKLQLQIYADVFKGALIFLQEKPFGYVTFVSHAARDIMNGLARDVRGDKRMQVQYVQHLDEIQKVWKHDWGVTERISEERGFSEHNIPFNVCEKIHQLVEDHKSGRERKSATDEIFFQTFLDYEDRHNIPPNLLKEWAGAREWFQKHAHIRAGSFDPDVNQKLQDHFKKLEESLLVAANSEFGRIKGINEILEDTNG